MLSLVEPMQATTTRPPAGLDPPLRSTLRSERQRGVAVRMRFARAGAAELVPGEPLAGVDNYFLGRDPDRWRTAVPRHAAVAYRGMYPGVDVEVYAEAGRLEYDLALEPGADLAAIAVEVDGALGMCIETDGTLSIETTIGPLRQAPPDTFWIDADGTRRETTCSYELRGATSFGFKAPAWHGVGRLIVDPALSYSTFLGGSNDDWANAVAIDATGTITLAGGTWSANYPTTPGAWDTVLHGSYDVVVSRLAPSRPPAQQLLFSTYLGGYSGDSAFGIAVDPAGVVTLTGETCSPDFPVSPNAWDTTLGLADAFVTRLDPSQVGARQLVYSTFLGSYDVEIAIALALDRSGKVTLVGTTWSSNYPTTAGAWRTTHSGAADAFVTQLDPSRPPALQLLYSTLAGGSRVDFANAVAVDALGMVTIAGQTSSTDYPTTASAWSRSHNGIEDVFVSRFDPSLSGAQQLVYSTLLGGDDFDWGCGVAVDVTGTVTLCGLARSLDFPTTPNAWSTTYNGGIYDAFVARLDPTRPPAQQLVYSTYVGGIGGEAALALAVDSGGVVTIAGSTSSANYPTTPGAWDTTFNGGVTDVFVMRLDPARPRAEQVLYSTFLGGVDSDNVTYGALASSLQGEATIVGYTLSGWTFPTTSGAFDRTPNGGSDAFAARLDLLPTGTRRYGTSGSGCNGPLAIAVTSMPRIGNSTFALSCTNAPPLAAGVVALAEAGLATPVRVLGIDFWIDPRALLLVPLRSGPRGTADMPLPLPQDGRFIGFRFHGQFLWMGPSSPAPCPILGLSSTAAIEITVHP